MLGYASIVVKHHYITELIKEEMLRVAISEEAKKARRDYMRKYRKNNPDKIRDINARYWERKAKQLEEVK